jgi:hypothetical protein
VVFGGVSLASDLRGYASSPRREARVARIESGCGWAVPVYRVACYAGVEEASGAKLTPFDEAAPSIGNRVMVACQPASEGMHAYSDADHRALLRRDVFFILIGAALGGVVALRRRAGASPKRWMRDDDEV